MKLTRAQAHRLIELYGYTGPRELVVARLTTAELFVFDAPRRDRLALDTDLSGEPVSWVAQNQIDRLIYGWIEPRPIRHTRGRVSPRRRTGRTHPASSGRTRGPARPGG